MAVTRISDNQIATATNAILTTLSFAQNTSELILPTGTTEQRPGSGQGQSATVGTLRFNSEIDNAEIYVADDGSGSAGWTAVAGGGPSVGEDSVIRTNHDTIEEDLTVGPVANNDDKYTNGMSSGPITISTGNTVTIESGASWSVV